MRFIALCVSLTIFASACTKDVVCRRIDDAMTIEKLNEAVRPEIEFVREDDGYAHTLEIEMSRHTVVYSDCGAHYTVKFIPGANADGTFTIGLTTTYNMSKHGMKVASILEE